MPCGKLSDCCKDCKCCIKKSYNCKCSSSDNCECKCETTSCSGGSCNKPCGKGSDCCKECKCCIQKSCNCKCSSSDNCGCKCLPTSCSGGSCNKPCRKGSDCCKGEFVNCYYECLKETLEKRGYAIQEIYSRSSFEEDMQRLTVAVLFQVAANHSVQFLDMDVVKNEVSSEEDGFKDILFDEKTTTKKNAFMYDPQFKAVIEEDLYELQRSLVKY
ncbi:hypothetical protein CBL_08329 [Carabus blaptoides fortunei]